MGLRPFLFSFLDSILSPEDVGFGIEENFCSCFVTFLVGVVGEEEQEDAA
jgi:hypothetical protein